MKFKLIITLTLLLFSQIIHAEVSVSVDRNPIVVDESFKLIFETDHKINAEPDFSSLDKSFTILNTGRRSNTQIVNGDVTRSQQWILTVIAKQSGVIAIPSIRFGNFSSKSSTINVLASASSTKGNDSSDFFIEVEVDTTSPYVQSQVIYTAKLYRAVQTNNAKLFDPEISGGQAVINRLGEDKSFETRLKGKRYIVTQRQFSIFPQSSGAIKVEPLMFQAEVGGAGGFGPFGPQPKLIVKRSESIELNVKPIPDSFTGSTWLPAKQLSVQEQWSIDPAKLKQGEATTRTLTLKAIGLPSSNLPEVKSNLPDKLKQYPDQPEFAETLDENGFASFRHDKMAIIPVEGGDYVLPVVKIPWWNTVTDEMEIAELPERMIHADISDAAPVTNIQELLVEENIMPLENEAKENIIPISESVINDQTPWKWISVVLFILWIMTLFIFWKSKRKSAMPNNDSDSSRELSRRQYVKQLKQACISNNAVMAKQAILDWAKLNWSNEIIYSINTVKTFCNESFQLKLDELNTFLYGKEESQWDGNSFLKSFESQIFDKKVTKEKKGKLESLYKS